MAPSCARTPARPSCRSRTTSSDVCRRTEPDGTYSRRAPSAIRGRDEAGLVGEHDELGPVAGAELDHRPAHVGARRRRADEQLLGDLVVAQPAGDQRDDLALAVGQHARARRRRPVRCSGRARTRRSAGGSRSGDSSASPPPRHRTARSSSVGLGVLQRGTRSRRRGSPRTRTRRARTSSAPRRAPPRGDGSATIARVASSPSSSGMRMSIKTTSGSSCAD